MDLRTLMPPEGIKPGPDRQDYPSIIPGFQLSNIWLIYCAYELIYIQTIHVFEGHCEWRVSLGSTREREREKESHSQTDLFNKWGHIGTSHIQMNGNLLIFDHIRRTTHHTHTHTHTNNMVCAMIFDFFCQYFALVSACLEYGPQIERHQLDNHFHFTSIFIHTWWI